MASPYPSRAHVILEAVRYASNGDIPALRQLTASRPDALQLKVSLRILLTYLPVVIEPNLYIDFLRDLPTISLHPSRHIPPSSVTHQEQDISEEQARAQLRRLHFVPLVDESIQHDQMPDPLTLFLLRRAYSMDAETGSLELITKLLEPFVDHSEVLRTWMISNLLPLLRLDYEYYPHSGPSHTLAEMGNIDGRLAVQTLLFKAAQRHDPGDTQNIGRDLRGLVGPWMYGERSRKRRRLSQRSRRRSSAAIGGAVGDQDATGGLSENSDWSHVNHWLVDLSTQDFQKAVDAAVQWDGPKDVDYSNWGGPSQPLVEGNLQITTLRYAQACLASLYATNTSSLETIIGSHRNLLRIARLIGHDEPPDLKRTDTPTVNNITRDYMHRLSPAHLLPNALLMPQNPFTLPDCESINLFNLVLTSSYKLLNLGNAKASRTVADLALFGSEADQMAELRKTLHNLKAERMDAVLWASIRRQILWLQNWEQQPGLPNTPQGVFSKIAGHDLEVEVLRAILEAGCYDLALDTYCKSANSSLSTGTVEGTVLSIALSAYDAASNGNRTRGGVRRASDIISAFRNQFPNSPSFKRISALLSATHAMSFYSLTLQHGVPFQPVNIRAHKDPTSLVGKILSQNPQSYTHLDDLLEIGQNLVRAGLTEQAPEYSADYSVDANTEHESVVANRRITRMAIEAALEEDDFDTAYSYSINRLSIDSRPRSSAAEEPGQLINQQDDISWRAAYEAGRFAVSSPGTLTLRRLEQRLELLSQALILAPPSALTEVLITWQTCEQEMNTDIAREAAEDERWDDKGDRKVPGGFATEGSPIVQRAREPARNAPFEEAPMGLFDVARGAAAALSKSTFPLRNTPKLDPGAVSSKASHGRPLSTASAGSSDEGSISGAGGPGRVRKRDMISNMVTGGLASGVGWVIGES